MKYYIEIEFELKWYLPKTQIASDTSNTTNKPVEDKTPCVNTMCALKLQFRYLVSDTYMSTWVADHTLLCVKLWCME